MNSTSHHLAGLWAVVFAGVLTGQAAAQGVAAEVKAREAFRAGQLGLALKLLERGGVSEVPPKVVVAHWCREAGDDSQARTLLEQAAAEDPDHPEVFLTNAHFALADERFLDAALSYQAALAAVDNPRFSADARRRFRREARQGLASVCAQRGDFAAARTHLVALLDAEPSNAPLRVELGRVEFALGRTEAALTALQAAHRLDPTLDPPEVELALLSARKRDFPAADDWFRRAIRAHPDSARCHRAYAAYLLDRGRPEEAKPHLATAAKLAPAARDTKALQGLLARHQADYPAAARLFEELVRDHPDFAFARANLALALIEVEGADSQRRAVEAAEALVRRNPVAESRTVLAYCLFKSGRLAEAEQQLDAAAGGRCSPDGAYFTARVLAARGKPALARPLLRNALDDPGAFVYRKQAQALLAELEKRE